MTRSSLAQQIIAGVDTHKDVHVAPPSMCTGDSPVTVPWPPPRRAAALSTDGRCRSRRGCDFKWKSLATLPSKPEPFPFCACDPLAEAALLLINQEPDIRRNQGIRLIRESSDKRDVAFFGDGVR